MPDLKSAPDFHVRRSLLTLRGSFRGPVETGALTLRPLLTRDFESFETEFRGCGRDPECSFRTLLVLSRNRESRRPTGSVAKRCGQGGNARTPGGEPLGVFCELVCRVSTQNRNELPGTNPLRTNAREHSFGKSRGHGRLRDFESFAVRGERYGPSSNSGQGD